MAAQRTCERGAEAHMPWRAQDEVRTELPEYDGRKALQCHVRRAPAEAWGNKPGCDTESEERKQGLRVLSR